jgi:hypothetical protein
MTDNFISVKEASERYGYSDSHIRNLLGKGMIRGEKFASVWMVDRRSIEQHKATMDELGKKKHGMWAQPSDGNEAEASKGQKDGRARA